MNHSNLNSIKFQGPKLRIALLVANQSVDSFLYVTALGLSHVHGITTSMAAIIIL